MTAPAAIADLEAAAAVLRRQACGACRRTAARLEAIATGAPADEALGLKVGPGQRRPTTVTTLAERDALIRSAAQRFWPDAPAAEQARALAAALLRYETTAWPRERNADCCPNRHAGTVQATAWRILSLGINAPGERQIRRILGATI